MPELPPAGTIPWEAVGQLVATSLAIMGSPGPATISVVAAVSADGVRCSLAYTLGTIIGTIIVLIAVASGITAALLTVPAIRSILTVVSVAYVLWLAYHVAMADPLSPRTTTSNVPSLTGGVLIGVANPKAWVAIAAVFAGAHLSDATPTDASAKTVVLTLMIIVIMLTWLLAGRSLAPLLHEPRRSRIVNVALALVLVGATVLAMLH